MRRRRHRHGPPHRPGEHARLRRLHGGRGSLHRRLFLWIAAAMLVAGLLSGAGAFLASRGQRGFVDPREAGRWAGDRFAERWGDPSARDALARDTAETFGIGVRLEDSEGRVLASAGPAIGGHRAFTIPVTSGDASGPREVSAPRGARLGTLTLSYPHDSRAPFRLVAGIALFLLGLWAASGAIARRLAQPLASAAAVADTIGEGGAKERLRVHPGSPREVTAFASALNRMADRVEAALASQRRLLAQVSHEVRTPLGHMRILVESAREGIGTDRVFTELERELATIDELVGELLAGERLAVHGLTRSRVDAVELAERALRRLGGDPAVLDARDRPIAIDADPQLLDRALANLLRNARDHGGDVTRLEVARQGEGRVRFVVEDHGPGIEARTWPELLDGKASAPRGLGLGLPLAQRIAVAHGGSLSLEPSERGARVALRIPEGDARTRRRA